MIRFANVNEKEQIIELWETVFGDSREALEMFLNIHFKPENTIVFSENSRIVSMFFLLEGNLVFKEESYSSYYLYAACTLPEFRGRGIMTLLIKFASEVAKERDTDFIFLLPAEESLYGYYSSFGFLPLFGLKRISVENDVHQINTTDFSNDKFNPEELFELRENSLHDIPHFSWNAKNIDFAVDFNRYYGGETVHSDNGYLLYSVSDGELNIKESAYALKETEEAALSLCDKLGCTKISINLPSYTADCGNKHGMALPLNESSALFLNNNRNVYLNLTLD